MRPLDTKKKRIFAISLILLLFVSGCGAAKEVIETYTEAPVNVEEQRNKVYRANGVDIIGEPTALYKNGGYYYDRITDDQKAIYEYLYMSVTSLEESCKLSSVNSNDINIAFQSMLFDHPEIFYTEGYQLETYDAEFEYSKFIPAYTKTADEITKYQDIIDSFTASALKYVNGNSDYDKCKAAFDYIVEKTEYDVRANEIDNLCSVMMYGKAVCEGYAKAMMYITNKAGIECIVIPGYIRSSGTVHMWNAIKLDGDWYYADPTWGDTRFENESKTPEIRYDYFCVTEDQLIGSHAFDSPVDLPKCTATKMNYYVKEGLVISSPTDKEIDRIMSRLSIDNRASFACTNRNVFNTVKDILISKRGVFDYVSGENSNRIGYSVNEDVLSCTFWIKQ